MNAAAAYSQPASSRRTRTPVLPADAATWLRARFDWTFGAVWVAMERWQVDAATVVAWAEHLRAGGARAGLSAKERTWMLRQLNDSEQRPTAVERAMARAEFLGREQQPTPVAINTIDDAIALIEARLADEGATDHTTRDARELRQMLLDDLRILRDGSESTEPTEQQSERSEPTMRVHGDVPVLASAVASVAGEARTRMGRPPNSEPKERPATCALCGKAFTAKRYGRDWTTYCSKSCGQQATMRRRQRDAQATTTATQEPEQVVADEPPTQAQQSTAAAAAAVDQEPYWNSERWTTLAELDGDEAADEQAAPTTQPTPPAQPASEPAQPEQPPVVALSPQWHDTIVRPAAHGARILGGDAPTAVQRLADEATDDALLTLLLVRLPRARAWTTRERARWLRAFTATLDLEITVSDEQGQSAEGQA